MKMVMEEQGDLCEEEALHLESAGQMQQQLDAPLLVAFASAVVAVAANEHNGAVIEAAVEEA
jgi:hypothetical protein